MNRTLTAASLVALAMITGCATNRLSQQAEGLESGTMDLEIAPGIIVNSASYTISGPGGFSRSGTIDVSQSTKLTALIGGLPPGNGFTITISAIAADGATTCNGSGAFNVVARTISLVNIHLTCHELGRTGGVLVNGNLNVCPVIDAVEVVPIEVVVGGTTSLGATAHDSDALPSALTYAWTTSSGSLGVTGSHDSSPTFTCTAPGLAIVTLTVSDGDLTPGCAATRTVPVLCTPSGFTPACLSCIKTNCGGPVCDTLFGNALEGPATGTSKAQLCNETVSCVLASGCGASDLSTCYCGTVTGTPCVDDGAGNGPCKAAFNRSFEAVQALDVPVRFEDTSFAGGAALTLLQCAADNCAGCL